MLISTEPTQEFNSSKTGPIDFTQLLLEFRNAAGDLLWVAEEARDRGLGSQLLATFARSRRGRVGASIRGWIHSAFRRLIFMQSADT